MKKEPENYPASYPAKTAIMDGNFVFGLITGNFSGLEQFLASAKAGKQSEILLVGYTTEGDPILTNIVYAKGDYYALVDASRDRFRGTTEEYSLCQMKYLKELEEGEDYRLVLAQEDVATYEEFLKLQEKDPKDGMLLAIYGK